MEMIRFCVGGFPGIPADLDFVPANFSLGCLRDDSPAFLFFRREADSLRSPLTVRSDMVNYAVRTIQVNKLGKERFMREGAVLEDDWEPFAAFYGQAEPWLLIRKKLN